MPRRLSAPRNDSGNFSLALLFFSLLWMQKRNTPVGVFLFGAADRIEEIKVLPPSRPAASGCPPDTHIFDRSSPAALDAKKEYPRWGIPFLVPLTGLEPVRSCPQRILSPRCLPFHHNGIYLIILTRLSKIVKWGTAHRPFPTFLFQQSIQKFRARFPELLPGAIII